MMLRSRILAGVLAWFIGVAPALAGSSSPGLPIVGAPVIGATASRVLSVDSSGKLASSYVVGTSASNLVQLDGSGKLPAVDGSQLTGISGGSVATTFAIGGCTIGSNALCVTGPSSLAVASDGTALRINSAVGWTIPALPNNTGTPWLAMLQNAGGGVNGAGTDMMLASIGNNWEAGITFMQAGGTPASPTNSFAGGISYIQNMAWVGGAINAWKQFSLLEMGNNGGNPNSLAAIQGQIQLGLIEGVSGNRVGWRYRTTSNEVTNGIPLYLYNTGCSQTDCTVSNYERAALSWSGNVFSVGPTQSGATLRSMTLTGASVSIPTLASVGGTATSSAAWTTSGLRLKVSAASYTDTSSTGTVSAAYTDLFGASTILASSAVTYSQYYGVYFQEPVASTNVTMTNKWALGADSARFGTASQLQIASNGTLTAAGGDLFANGGNIRTAAAGLHYWTARSVLSSPADGVILLQNNAQTDFTRAQFGGTTNAFGAVKRFGNTVGVRRADDTIATFSTLTACSSAGEGALAPVSDSSTATWGATITGSGSNHVLAYCNGTNWTVAAM